MKVLSRDNSIAPSASFDTAESWSKFYRLGPILLWSSAWQKKMGDIGISMLKIVLACSSASAATSYHRVLAVRSFHYYLQFLSFASSVFSNVIC